MLDTHQLAKELTASGFDAGQTETLVAAFKQREGDLVTKDFLRAELQTFRQEVMGSIAGLRTETQNSIAELRTETRESIAGLRSDNVVLKWMTGFGLTMGAAILIKLFVN